MEMLPLFCARKSRSNITAAGSTLMKRKDNRCGQLTDRRSLMKRNSKWTVEFTVKMIARAE